MFMIKKNLTKRLLLIALCAVMLVSFMAVVLDSYKADAASTVSMTVYEQVIKRGNTIYCSGVKGIYKVKLKNGKVKSKKLLLKDSYQMGAHAYMHAMKKSGNYIYYLHDSEGTMWTILRVNIKTGKEQYIDAFGENVYFGYVKKGKRIYFDDGDIEKGSRVYSIALNGKSKKRASSVIPVMKSRVSNASGYSMKIRESGGYAKDYLTTPKGTFYLGKVNLNRY